MNKIKWYNLLAILASVITILIFISGKSTINELFGIIEKTEIEIPEEKKPTKSNQQKKSGQIIDKDSEKPDKIEKGNDEIVKKTTNNFIGKAGVFSDKRNMQTYKWIKIGNQIWMAENLSFKPNKGSMVYNNDERNSTKYGRLYNWETACEVCPDGWSLPSERDWNELFEYLGGNLADKLKSRHGWDGNNNGNNSSEFSALPGESFYNNLHGFSSGGDSGEWWCHTEYVTEYGRYGTYIRVSSSISSGFRGKADALSVRCIKD